MVTSSVGSCSDRRPVGRAPGPAGALALLRTIGQRPASHLVTALTGDREQQGYELGGELFPTLVRRDYRTERSGHEAASDLTSIAVAAGWEPSWSVCEETMARVGFRHPDRDDVLLTSQLAPSDGAVSITVTGIFDSPGWARTGTESMECFDGVVERCACSTSSPG